MQGGERDAVMREVLSANFRKRRRANQRLRKNVINRRIDVEYKIPHLSDSPRDRFDRVFEDNAIWSIHFFYMYSEIPKERSKMRSPLEKFAGRTRRYRIARYEIENAAPKTKKKKDEKKKKKRKKQEKKSFNPSRRDSTPKLPFRRPCPKKNPPLCSNKDLGKVILSE